MPKRLSARAYVYAIRRGDGAIKIGHSNDLKCRMSNLCVEGHRDLQPIYWLERNRSDANAIEFLCHWLMRERCVAGEWFSLSAGEAIATIEDAAKRFDAGERAPRHAEYAEPVESVSMMLPQSLARRLTEWRAAQSPLPNRSDAIRRLLEMALDAAEAAAAVKTSLTPSPDSGDMSLSPSECGRVDGLTGEI